MSPTEAEGFPPEPDAELPLGLPPQVRPALARRFYRRDDAVEMIVWDGSDEAARLIADKGGRSPLAQQDAPLPRNPMGDLEIWQAGASRFTWLRLGDWAATSGGGVWPVTEIDREAEYEEITEAAPFGAPAPDGSAPSATGAEPPLPFAEFAIAWGGDDPNDCAGILTYDDEAEAAEMTQWISGSYVARRTVTRTRWERIEEVAP